LQKSDIDGYRAEDLLFHQMLWMLSGNDRVRRAGESLQDQMRLGNAVSSRRPGRAAQSVVEHLAIVDAILVGDADAAEKAARRHIQLTAENFDEELGSGEPADPKGFELDKVGTVTGSTNPAKLTIQ
jgi:DNA-binding GntR family transcriptional regulator